MDWIFGDGNVTLEECEKIHEIESMRCEGIVM